KILSDGNRVDLIRARISPDPVTPGQNVTFEVSGILSDDITDSGMILIQFSYEDGSLIGHGNGFPAPQTKAGSIFNTNPTFEAPANLPSKYAIIVFVVGNSSDPSNKVIGCVATVVGD
ncbi:31_t:CDS:1, partial [Dentiscutata erythropus]